MLGGTATLHYLTALDVKTSRCLKKAGLAKDALKEAAYLLVTYAIELRAEELYPIYEELLRKGLPRLLWRIDRAGRKEHLKEINEGPSAIAMRGLTMQDISKIEELLCKKWIDAIMQGVARCKSRIRS